MEENKESLIDGSVADENSKAANSNEINDIKEAAESEKIAEVNDLQAESSSEIGVSEESVDENAQIKAATDQESSEDGDSLEYATTEGSWASYEAERERENVGRGNGVYPDNVNSYNTNSGWGTRNGGYGSYFGTYGYNSSNAWNDYTKPKSKKKPAFYIGIAALALAVVIAFGFGVFKLFSVLNDLVNEAPQSSAQGGAQSGGSQSGGSQGGTTSGGQSGGTQSGSGTTTGSSSLQNGAFTLEQVTAEEHYKLSTVYQLTESTVVAIKSSIGSGSGVIISKDDVKNDGYFIVTNNHVIEGGTNIKVTLSNGTVYSAELIGRDENTDLAVLKVIATDLNVASVGKSGDLLVAEEVLIIGNPLGTLGGTATNGIVSAKNRVISIDGYAMTLIQTNAAINPGNSGGAMFNMAGQLVGVVNAKYAAEEIEGIGFAIPIDIAKGIIEDLINYGFVKGRNNLGFKVTYGVNSRIDSYYSYWVTELVAGSDAEKAGLKLNDRLMTLRINGVSHSGENLASDLNALKSGDVVVITVRRYSSTNGFFLTYQDHEITITVTEYLGTGQ